MRVRLLCLCEGMNVSVRNIHDRGPPATIRVAIRAGNPEPSHDWIATLSKTKARDDNAQFGLRFSILGIFHQKNPYPEKGSLMRSRIRGK